MRRDKAGARRVAMVLQNRNVQTEERKELRLAEILLLPCVSITEEEIGRSKCVCCRSINRLDEVQM